MDNNIVIPAGSLVKLHLEDSPSIATLDYQPTERHARPGHTVEVAGKVYRFTDLTTGRVSYAEEV